MYNLIKHSLTRPGSFGFGFFACLLLLNASFSACKASKTSELTIAAASSMQFAIEDMVVQFTKETGINAKLITGASGMLTSQIREGAPYHLFLSADKTYPEYLAANGFSSERPSTYAMGELVFWTTTQTTVPEISRLPVNANLQLAIANPETAPYGKAAVQALKFFGMYSSLEKQLVYGQSISQTNQFIITGAVYGGFTAKSVVMAPVLKDKGVWKPVSAEAYSPIEQAMIILRSDPATEKKAIAFKEFLFSSTGRRILENYGYVPVKY